MAVQPETAEGYELACSISLLHLRLALQMLRSVPGNSTLIHKQALVSSGRDSNVTF